MIIVHFHLLLNFVCFVLPYLAYRSSVWDPAPRSAIAIFVEKVWLLHLKCAPKMVSNKLNLPPCLLSASLSFHKVLTETYPSFQIPTQSRLSTCKFTSFSSYSHYKDLRPYHPLSLMIDFHHTCNCRFYLLLLMLLT